MPVPDEDLVCRFVRKRDWCEREKRPNAAAFKDKRGLTVWHIQRLSELGAELGQLKIEHLRGNGEAHHKAGDYRAAAQWAEDKVKEQLQVDVSLDTIVEWRPEDVYVAEAWRAWREAHVQVETQAENAALKLFRERLLLTMRYTAPPDP